jgi:hypothetical protein
MLDLQCERSDSFVFASGMFKLSGEKLNLSSGIASAASIISFSMAVISPSTTEAMAEAVARGMRSGQHRPFLFSWLVPPR